MKFRGGAGYSHRMGITYHPDIGEVLWCDYSGMEPEMVKRRLCVVITPRASQRPHLTTVVPISSTPPEAVRPWHVKLDRDPLPDGSAEEVWVKCDMVSAVSFDRLGGYYKRWNRERKYRKITVSMPELVAIRHAVGAALGLNYTPPAGRTVLDRETS